MPTTREFMQAFGTIENQNALIDAAREIANNQEKLKQLEDTGMIMDASTLIEQQKQEQDYLDTKIDMRGYHRQHQRVREYNISRNDLCPCGSGKKYKNCCLLSGKYEKLIVK